MIIKTINHDYYNNHYINNNNNNKNRKIMTNFEEKTINYDD